MTNHILTLIACVLFAICGYHVGAKDAKIGSDLYDMGFVAGFEAYDAQTVEPTYNFAPSHQPDCHCDTCVGAGAESY